MKYSNILITGGSGFVGSGLAIKLKEYYPNINVICLDNLKRRGSELNISRLVKKGIEFVHGDVRNKEDFELNKKIDLIIECSAEPSVLAGINGSPEYVINTNLVGAINCLEFARKNQSDFLFLSSSRVYPIHELNDLKYKETDFRFELENNQVIEGASKKGVSENFPLGKTRSLYGATKLSTEYLLQEYIQSYGIKGVINRFGIITGPWQMGKIDQGVIVLWIARHLWKSDSLSYVGFGGNGKQVRDFIHIDDVFDVINIQLKNINKHNSEIYNIGGGETNSLSLLELTKLCVKHTGNKIKISNDKKDRPNDVRVYISDSSKFQKISNWSPKKGANETVHDILRWMVNNKKSLEYILK